MFDEVIGQQDAKETLGKYQDRLPSAVMLYGPSRVGKYALARAFVRKTYCRDSGLVDCKCRSCAKLRLEAHPDLHVVQPENGRIAIDAIRKLSEVWRYSTSEADHKFAIIRRAEKLTNQAAQALLKILEEPGDQASIIVTTSAFIRLPVTIRSRCQFVKCSYLETNELTQIASMQQKTVSPQAYELWSGSYSPEAWVEQLTVLKFAWDPGAHPPAQIEVNALQQELKFVGSVYVQMLKQNLTAYREVNLLRPTPEKFTSLFYETDRALWYLERGVKPWLVAQWFAHRVRSRN